MFTYIYHMEFVVKMAYSMGTLKTICESPCFYCNSHTRVAYLIDKPSHHLTFPGVWNCSASFVRLL